MKQTTTCPVCKKNHEVTDFSEHANVIPLFVICSVKCRLLFHAVKTKPVPEEPRVHRIEVSE